MYFAGKLIVHEAWDEPTSLNPNGEHGNTSLHYEGRAAVVSVSTNVTIAAENDPELSPRLQSLAVCAGFPYVSSEDERHLVHVAVKEEEPTHIKRKTNVLADSKDRQAFENALSKLGKNR